MLLLEETLILLRVQRYKFSIYKKGVCTFLPKNRMNEWPLNFSVKKKKKKTTHKNAVKKRNKLLYKNRNFIKIWLNDRWTFPREMKKKTFFFFFPLRGNTVFWYEWINDQRPCPRKKNTVTLKPFFLFFFFIRNSVRENKKPCVKKIIFVCVKIYNQCVKKIIFVCVKIYTQYVKSKEKVYVKNPTCAWKFWKKCTWNATSIREKSEKIAKKPFHAHFLFSRTKKNTAPEVLVAKNAFSDDAKQSRKVIQ